MSRTSWRQPSGCAKPTYPAWNCPSNSDAAGAVRSLGRRAVKEVATKPWSFSERQAHQLLASAGISGWAGNPPIRLACGLRCPDIAIEELELVIELDGRAHHTRVNDFDHDYARHNDFVREGWTVLRFTAKQVADQPDVFIKTIKDTIEVLRRKARRSGRN